MNQMISEAAIDLRQLQSADPPRDPLRLFSDYRRSLYPHAGLYHLLSFIGSGEGQKRAFNPKVGVVAATPLGELALKFKDEALLNVSFDSSICCDEAEPRFLKALHFNRLGRESTDPAVIYVDSDSRPIAYRKNNNASTVLTLYDGRPFEGLPAGTIVAFLRDEDTEVATANPVVQVGLAPRDSFVAVKRPATFALDPDYVQAAEYEAPYLSTTAGVNFSQLVVDTSLADIRTQVEALAGEARVS